MRSTQQPRGRVLAVDDSSVTRELVTAALEAIGYSVHAVDDGDAAICAARKETFDAVILDVEMPGIDGFAVGRALRDDPKTYSAMIAMHTSLDEASVREGFEGYDVFLPKPFDARLLQRCVTQMVGEGRRRRRVARTLPPDLSH
jgi:CheY-like chemotaxis protein